jgi:hypothetical protein
MERSFHDPPMSVRIWSRRSRRCATTTYSVSVVIEVKGCWNANLEDMDRQLKHEYLGRSRAQARHPSGRLVRSGACQTEVEDLKRIGRFAPSARVRTLRR